MQDQTLSEMMKQHISNGFSYPYEEQYAGQLFQEIGKENSPGPQSSTIEHDTEDNEQFSMPIAYKKRMRIKFSQEQLDTLEATFHQHHYPTVDVVDDLVERLDLPTQKITVWFQNRRARLKKSQPKLKDEKMIDKVDQQQYDSGIHLDDDTSHESSPSPTTGPSLHLPAPPHMNSAAPCYLPEPHQSFYQNMWSNFPYSMHAPPFQPTMTNHANGLFHNPFSFNSSEMFPSFAFHDMSNYQYRQDFNGEL